MAAYDLNLQKPSSLAIPKTAGASDLARFLSVSESKRANKEKEDLNQDIFSWEQGAGDRKQAAEQAERERIRNRNTQLDQTLSSANDNYLKQTAGDFKFHDEAKAKLRSQYPNMTDEHLEQILSQKREEVTSNPNLYADPRQMAEALKSNLMQDGFSKDDFNGLVNPRVQSNFDMPSAPMNEEVLKGYIDVIKAGGLTDNIKNMEIVQGANGEAMAVFTGGSGSGSNGNLDQDEYRESSQYVQEILNDPNNEFRKGRRSWFTANLPWTRDEAYRDDLEQMIALGENSEKIQPQYIAGIMQAITSEGQLPKGVKAKDLKDPEGEFYQTVMDKARDLQARDSGGYGAGAARASGAQQGIPLSTLRELQQGDLQMQTQALSQLLGQAGGARQGPLTQQEQYELLNDEDLLREFGLILEQQSNPQQGGAAPVAQGQTGENDILAQTLAQNMEGSGSGNPVAADGGNARAAGSAPAIDLNNETPPAPANARDILLADLARLSGRPAPSGRAQANDHRAEIADLQNQIKQFDQQQEQAATQELTNSLESMTQGQLKTAVPDEFMREKAEVILDKVQDGSASAAQTRILIQILEDANKQ